MSENVDAMGGETVTVGEVNQPSEAVQEQAQSSEQSNKVPEAVPYDRFSQVNSEKNDYKEKYEQQVAINNEHLNNANQFMQAQAPQAETAQIDSVEDLMKAVDLKVNEATQSYRDQQHLQSLNMNKDAYFNGNPEAKALETQILDLYKSKPTYMQAAIDHAVSMGDTSVLDEMKNTVALQHNGNVKNMANEAALKDANKTLSPTAHKVVKETGGRTKAELLAHGKKTGDFSGIFGGLIKAHDLVN